MWCCRQQKLTAMPLHAWNLNNQNPAPTEPQKHHRQCHRSDWFFFVIEGGKVQGQQCCCRHQCHRLIVFHIFQKQHQRHSPTTAACFWMQCCQYLGTQCKNAAPVTETMPSMPYVVFRMQCQMWHKDDAPATKTPSPMPHVFWTWCCACHRNIATGWFFLLFLFLMI